MAVLLLVVDISLVPNPEPWVERPVGVNADLPLKDTDELPRRDRVNLSVWSQVGVRVQREKTCNVFFA